MCKEPRGTPPWLWAAAAAPFVVPVAVKVLAAGVSLAEGFALTVFGMCAVVGVALLAKLGWLPRPRRPRRPVPRAAVRPALTTGPRAIGQGAPLEGVVVRLPRPGERVHHVR